MRVIGNFKGTRVLKTKNFKGISRGEEGFQSINPLFFLGGGGGEWIFSGLIHYSNFKCDIYRLKYTVVGETNFKVKY